jgi:hypothetical protein
MTTNEVIASPDDETPKMHDIIETLRYLYDKLQAMKNKPEVSRGCTMLQASILFFEESERSN